MMAAGRLFCVGMIVKKPETQVLLLKFSRQCKQTIFATGLFPLSTLYWQYQP